MDGMAIPEMPQPGLYTLSMEGVYKNFPQRPLPEPEFVGWKEYNPHTNEHFVLDADKVPMYVKLDGQEWRAVPQELWEL